MGIWQDLVSQAGFPGGYQTVKRFVHKLRGSQTPEACAVIITAPGEEAQVDYGRGPMVRDPETGKYRRTRLFVLTLGYSRKAVRLLTFRSSSRIWAELHEKAFRRLGGCPRVVVLDNLREGVLQPDIYDPTLNPLFRDVLAHYGVLALPCRVNHPDRKGKVESGVGHAKKTPLKGKRFESLEEGQVYLDQWETNWADTRIHGTTKRQVAAMFAEEVVATDPPSTLAYPPYPGTDAYLNEFAFRFQSPPLPTPRSALFAAHGTCRGHRADPVQTFALQLPGTKPQHLVATVLRQLPPLRKIS
jgi:transposase